MSYDPPKSSYSVENLSEIPIKVNSRQNFGISPPPPATSTSSAPAQSPPLSCAKIADIDISFLFTNGEVDIEQINSLAALTLLNFLVTKLMVESDDLEEDNDHSQCQKDDEFHDATCPLSPTKRRQSEVESGSSLIKGFSLKTPPDLSLTQYLERINQYCGLSSAVYLATTFYIYKLAVDTALIRLNRFNVHRLIIAALRISCKALEDINHKQQFVAKIGGVNLNDLQFLEISFLFLIKFECHVDPPVLADMLKNLKSLYHGNSSVN